MPSKIETPARTKLLAIYDDLIATLPGIERKGDTMPYTSINGNMFSYIDKDDTLALRLPAEAREAFIQKHDSQLHQAYGITQKEYVDVPKNLLGKTALMKKYMQVSYEYVSGLKPKPTKKK